MMIKSILDIYFLAICFVSSLIIMVSSVLMLDKITDFAFPEYKYYEEKFASNQKFIDFSNEKTQKKLLTLSVDQLTETRESQKKIFIQGEKAKSFIWFIKQLQWFLIGMTFFTLHWILYKKNRKHSKNM